MSQILIIYTGGTIGMMSDPKNQGAQANQFLSADHGECSRTGASQL